MGLLKRYDKAVATNTGLASENPEATSPSKQGNPENQFKGSNLDLEYKAPAGGPINSPQYGHQQNWLPQNGRKFTDSDQGQKWGGVLKGTYDKTSLDLTNPLPLGGPINVPYSTLIGSELKSFNTTQPYTPKNTYKDSLQSAELKARASDPIR
jgi:hypothetical protein